VVREPKKFVDHWADVLGQESGENIVVNQIEAHFGFNAIQGREPQKFHKICVCLHSPEGGNIRPAKANFSALNLPFRLKFGQRDTNKGAMWPEDEINCPPLA